MLKNLAKVLRLNSSCQKMCLSINTNLSTLFMHFNAQRRYRIITLSARYASSILARHVEILAKTVTQIVCFITIDFG